MNNRSRAAAVRHTIAVAKHHDDVIDWEAHFRFLDTASIGELFARRDLAYEVRRQLVSPEALYLCNKVIKTIDAELVARGECAQVQKMLAGER